MWILISHDSQAVIRDTIFFSINNKLQNPEAAHGVLVYAMNNAKIDLVGIFLPLDDNCLVISY